MPYRRFRRFGRFISRTNKTRVYRRFRSRKISKKVRSGNRLANRRYVKKQISRNIEKKWYSNVHTSTFLNTGIIGDAFGYLQENMALGQGVGLTQRIGEKINPQWMKLCYTVNRGLTNGAGNDVKDSGLARMIIYRQKLTDQGGISPTTVMRFNTVATKGGFVSNSVDTDRYEVYHDRMFKLGLGNNSIPGNTAYPVNINYVDGKVYIPMPKTQRYAFNGTQLDDEKRWCIRMLFLIGDIDVDSQYTITLNYLLKYKDA